MTNARFCDGSRSGHTSCKSGSLVRPVVFLLPLLLSACACARERVCVRVCARARVRGSPEPRSRVPRPPVGSVGSAAGARACAAI